VSESPQFLSALDLPEAPPVTRATPGATRTGPPTNGHRPWSEPKEQVEQVPPRLLGPLDLPEAPPVTRAVSPPMRRPKLPAIGLLGLGVVLTLGPIVGGLFSKVAAGQQLIDQFAPHMEPGTLARYHVDLGLLRNGATGVDYIYRQEHIPNGRFPLLDEYRSQAPGIDRRATGLLDRVEAAEPDYRRVAAIGGFDRVTFLIVGCGIVAVCGGCVLLAGRRHRARWAVIVVVLAGAAVSMYPFVSNLPSGARAGQQMLPALAPVMTSREVAQLQRDFVVIVEAVGELDTSFRQVPRSGSAATDITALVEGWPMVSSDLASLVGVVEDNIGNYSALESLNTLTRNAGVSGLAGLPWLLVGAGLACAGLSIAALPRRKKEAA
jgi:hypothetical protein